eukprot:574694-Prorocentrum_minimum.AAC.1
MQTRACYTKSSYRKQILPPQPLSAPLCRNHKFTRPRTRTLGSREGAWVSPGPTAAPHWLLIREYARSSDAVGRDYAPQGSKHHCLPHQSTRALDSISRELT